MIFEPTRLAGAYIIDLERREDERGFFARVWCGEEFARHDLETRVAQVNLSHNRLQGTLRGMHFQHPPHAETKLVRCVRGAIYDVIIDLRPSSPTYREWIGVELTADNRRALFVPEGFAHGFQTLVDDSDVMYQVSAPYSPGAEGGVRFDDPAFGISWPLPVTMITAKDQGWPLDGEA